MDGVSRGWMFERGDVYVGDVLGDRLGCTCMSAMYAVRSE